MRALRLGGVLLVALVGFGSLVWGATPEFARSLARERGVEVGAIGWCPEARPWAPSICAREIRSRGATARALRLDPSGELVVEGIRAPWGWVKDRLGAPSATVTGSGWRPSRLRVSDLRVEDAPVELPALRGELLPEVRLEGPGVRVEGRTVAMDLPTPWGTVSLRGRPDAEEAGAVRLEASAPELVATLPSLGAAPVRLRDVRLEGLARVESKRFQGTIDTAGVRLGAELAWTDAGLEGSVVLPPTPVPALLALWSEGLPEVRSATVAGSAGATVRGRFPEGPFEVEPSLEGLRVVGLVGPNYRRGGFSYPCRDAAGERATCASGEGAPGWTPLQALGPWLPAAVIAAEDGRFLQHRGYDLASMQEAARANLERGEVWRGGSTLTQQLAKNLFLDGRRTYGRKLRELLYAVNLEGALGKSRILELYLNVAEWGPGIHGAAAASEAYFARSPAGLLPEEAAWLASILPMPRSAWTQQYLSGAPEMARVSRILTTMQGCSEAERAAALQRPLRFVPPARLLSMQR